MKAKFFIFLPFIFLAGAVVINYLRLPMEWFLVSTGFLVLYVVFSKDDTKKSEPEAPTKQSFEVKDILEGINDAAFVYDRNFKIVAFNKASEKMFGINGSEVIGKIIEPKDSSRPGWQRFTQIFFPSLSPSMMTRSKEGEFPQVIDISFASPELAVRTITSEMGKMEGGGFLKIVHDRTREAVSMREKSEFITVASHQLRTPVTSVIWAVDALAQAQELPENLKEIALSAQENAKRLGSLVEDLLNISKIEEGRLGYVFNPIDISDFTGKILSAVMPHARRLGIKVFYDKPAEQLPPVFVDETKLGMALGNLIDNAIRYNVKDGEVVVRIKQDPNNPFVEISVRDTGIGIPSDDIKNLFSKFFRAQNAVKFETHGSGLGLYITQNIIQAHGGSLNVESEMNKGSVFSITLPTDRSLIPPAEVPLM